MHKYFIQYLFNKVPHKISIIIISLFLFANTAKAQLFSNTSFENGPNTSCNCADSYICGQNTSRVVDGREPLYKKGNTGCNSFPGFIGSTTPLGAHSGKGYIYFYAGLDGISTDSIRLTECQLIEVCVWYAAPSVAEAPIHQNDSTQAFFILGVDNLNTLFHPSSFKQESPEQKIPAGTVWTQYCYTFEVNAGFHNFSVSAGGFAQYAMWVDDFTVNPVDLKVDLLKNPTNDTILCNSEALTLNAAALSSPMATDSFAKSFLWSNGSTDSIITIDSSGTYWVKMSMGCEETFDTINVLSDKSIVDLGKDTMLCGNENLVLDATISNSSSYLWQDNSSNPIFNVSKKGSYWVKATSINSCITSDTIEIEYNDLPIVNLGVDTTICLNETLILNATVQNSSSYLWQDNSSDSIFNVIKAGKYWVSVANVNNCVATDTIKVEYLDLPIANLIEDTVLCEGDLLTLDLTNNNASYLWQDGTVNPIYYISDTGLYIVTVTNICGFVTDSINIEKLNCEEELNVSNIFTPNFDNVNDDFSVEVRGIKEISAKIYNRWGELVWDEFNIKNIQEHQITQLFIWDGRTINAKEVSPGTYFYTLQYLTSNNELKVRQGAITLLR